MSEESNVREQQYRRYHRTQIAELRPYIEGEDMTDISVSNADLKNGIEGEDMTDISVSNADLKNGSPKAGDMIARNPRNPEDLWLIAQAYFRANFEEVKE